MLFALAACSPVAPSQPTVAPAAAPNAPATVAPAVAPAAAPVAPVVAPVAAAVATPAVTPLERLYAAARTEGAVIWQAGILDQAAEDIGQAFSNRYPGIQVTFNPISEPDVAARVITEASAGSRKVQSIDVAHGSPTQFKPLLERDMLVATDWASLGVEPSRILADGKWIANEDSVNLWIYNTQLVSAADAPKQFEDLLGPKWKGKKIVTNASAAGLAQLYMTTSEEQATKFLTALKGQELVITKSKGPAREMVTSGQAYIGISTVKDFLVLKSKGAPVEAAALGPMDRDVRGWYLPLGIQHPNAAQLFAAWMVSPEGWAAQQEAGVDIATPCDASEVSRLLCERGIKYVDYQTVGLELFQYYEKADANQALAQKALGITAQ
jgi:iron(III) transport system substrate-binding protein